MRYSEDIEKLVDSAGFIHLIYQNKKGKIRQDQEQYIKNLLEKLRFMAPEIQNHEEVISAKQDLKQMLKGTLPLNK